MNGFQILGITLCGGFALLVMMAVFRRRLRPLPGAAWLSLWTAAVVAIARPGLTQTIASALGIQRGADLTFYLAILGAFVGAFLLYARIRRLEEGLTTVVRRLAIAEARHRIETHETEDGSDEPPTPE